MGALSTLSYGECANNDPGADTSKRLTWNYGRGLKLLETQRRPPSSLQLRSLFKEGYG